MAAEIYLRALRAFVLNGERIARGACFRTPPLTAAALRYRGDADFEPEPETPEAKPSRRRVYRRRDLRPED